MKIEVSFNYMVGSRGRDTVILTGAIAERFKRGNYNVKIRILSELETVGTNEIYNFRIRELAN